MDYKQLEIKRDFIKSNFHLLAKEIYENYASAFEVEYTHNSTAIEGNTLTLMETKLLLEDKLSVGGKKLREIYEVVNHKKAFGYVKQCIAEQKTLDENIVKDIHSMLMDNIMVGGIYRNVDVYISGARHTPPTPNEMYRQIKAFYFDLSGNSPDAIHLAAWTHAEFVKIHPFVDGNGRTARLIMNYQLMKHGFFAISIAKEDRLAYFEKLEAYALDGNIEPFAQFIGELEENQLDLYINAINQATK
ncbi:MAG: Fic family protein [Ruminococcus sp.]|nr:Fic family protein [Ruminococcus sp.]